MPAKSTRAEKYYASVKRRQNLGQKLLFFTLQILAALGIGLLGRYTTRWRSSLRKTINVRSKVSPASKSEPSPALLNPIPAKRMNLPKRGSYAAGLVDLLRNSFKEWNQDKCPQLGAALAYYTVFSLAPLIVVLLSVFGLIYGNVGQARERILDQLGYLVDSSGLKVIQDIANNVAQPKAGILAAAIGILVALFGASGIFGQLQDALNIIWEVKPKPDQGILGFIRTRFLSFAMVGGVCFLLLASLTLEGLLRGLHSYLQSVLPGGHYLGLAIFYIFDLAIILLLFAMIFRYLPDAKIAWRDVWIGAALTAILFLIGKFLLGLYLSSGAASSAYGAASSLVTLLLWIFYSAQILLFGAEFTKVYANRYGSHVEPEEHAVRVERKEIELPGKSESAVFDEWERPSR
jgi:membrane protein